MRGIRLLGHPAHQGLTDLPIGFWTFSLICDVIGFTRNAPLWWTMAYWSQMFGLIAAVPTVLTGLLDLIYEVPPGRPRTVAVVHMLTNAAAAILYVISFIARGGDHVPGSPGLALGANAVGFAALGFGGWLGGELIQRYGVGRIEDPGRPIRPPAREREAARR